LSDYRPGRAKKICASSGWPANESFFRQIMSNDALAVELRRLIQPAVYQSLRDASLQDQA
jgi:hypothetical protein